MSQVRRVDATDGSGSVPLLEILEDDDVGPLALEHVDNMSLLKLRAACRTGRAVATRLFCPVAAYKRVGFWLGHAGSDLFLSKLVKEGELRLLQHAYLIAHDSKQWDGSRVVWGREVLLAAAESGRIDILDWMHNHAEPKIKMDHEPTGGGLSTTAAARAGHLETLKWMRQQQPPFKWKGYLYNEASRCGQLHVLEWAYAQTPRCPVKGSEMDPEDKGKGIGIVWHLECARRHVERSRLCSYPKEEMEAREQEYAQIVAKAQPVVDWIRPRLSAHARARLDRLQCDAPLVVWNGDNFVDLD